MTVSIDRIVQANITRATRTLSRRSFSVAMLVGFHNVWPEREREYEDADSMVADGFSPKHPLVLAARALTAQDPSPERFKVGRRVGAPAQTIRLIPSTPIEAEVFSLTIDGVTFSATADASPSSAEIVTALHDLMIADPDAVLATPHATAAAPVVVDTADYDGVLGGGDFAPPRNITLVLNSHADWDLSVALVEGVSGGRATTETMNIPNGGNTTVVGTKVWDRPPKITIPTQSGTGGTFTVGVGVKFNDTLAFTPTASGTHLDIASTGTGAWFAFSGLTSNLAFEDRTMEPGTTLATDLAAIRAADADWLALVVVDAQSAAQIAAVAAWAETQSIVYVPHSADSAVADAVDTDIASLLLQASYFKTDIVFSPGNHGRFPEAALLGDILGSIYSAGSTKAKPKAYFRQLVGILPDDFSADEVTRLIGTRESPVSGKHVVIYTSVAATGTNQGTPVTLGGLTAGGEWFDVIIGIYLIQSLLQASVFERMLASDLPMTSVGIASLEGTVRRALNITADAPYDILDGSTLTTQTTPVQDVSDADRQARFYSTGGGVRWNARTQSGIAAVNIGGAVQP